MERHDYTPAGIMARFDAMLKNYDDGSTSLGEPPKPLFDEAGEFSPDNWNSGQDIRALLQENGVFDERMDEPFEAWVYPDTDEEACPISHGIFWSGEKRDDNQAYIILNVITDSLTVNCDTYLISWYKTRGRVEVFTKNGHPIALDEYAALLGLLGAAGFFP